MKKVLLFLMMVLTSMSFCGCSSSDDGDDEPSTPQVQTKLGEIETEGSYIGRDQVVEFKCPQTLAEGKSVLWSVDGNAIGSTDNTKDSVIWTATAGKHTVTASVDNITKTKSINVIECDLGIGIIGDPSSKILRTLGLDKVYSVDEESVRDGNLTYTFENRKLVKIESEVRGYIAQQTGDYLQQPLTVFYQYYGTMVARCGQPVSSNFSDLDFENMDYTTKANWGLSIVNGSAWLSCVFKTQAGNSLSMEMTGRSGALFTIDMTVE